METEEKIGFLEALFGSESGSGEYLAFIIFTLVSMLLVKLIRYERKRKKLKAQIPPVILKFNIRTSISDNLIDFVTAFISAFIFFRFLPDLGHKVGALFGLNPITEKMLYGVILGVAFQYIWHKVLNKVSLPLNNK